MAACMIHCHVALIATSHASLITNFQPPLIQINTSENKASFTVALHNAKQYFTNNEYNFIPRTLKLALGVFSKLSDWITTCTNQDQHYMLTNT